MKQTIEEIVSKEALEQVDLLNSKLKESLRLNNKLGDSVTMKIHVLSDLLSHSMVVNPEVIKVASQKLKELIPLL